MTPLPLINRHSIRLKTPTGHLPPNGAGENPAPHRQRIARFHLGHQQGQAHRQLIRHPDRRQLDHHSLQAPRAKQTKPTLPC